MEGNSQTLLLKVLDGYCAALSPGRDREIVAGISADLRTGFQSSADRSLDWPDLAWEPFREGIDLFRLSPPDVEEPAAALLRYQAGASAPYHMHMGGEHIAVLEGAQQDERGRYPRGAITHNPAGSSHSVSSPEGCVVAIVWEKPVRFL